MTIVLPKRSRAERMLGGIDRLLRGADERATASHTHTESEIELAYARYVDGLRGWNMSHVPPRPTGRVYDWCQDQHVVTRLSSVSDEALTLCGPMDGSSILNPSALLAVMSAVDHAAAVAVESLIDDYRRTGRGRVDAAGCREVVAAELWSAVQDGIGDCREFMEAE